jgi:hypothetical protein
VEGPVPGRSALEAATAIHAVSLCHTTPSHKGFVHQRSVLLLAQLLLPLLLSQTHLPGHHADGSSTRTAAGTCSSTAFLRLQEAATAAQQLQHTIQ